MYKIFLCVSFFCVLFFAYVVGVRQGKTQCKGDVALSAGQEMLREYNKNLESREKINEKVITTGLDDIRNFLRQKYTIAD